MKATASDTWPLMALLALAALAVGFGAWLRARQGGAAEGAVARAVLVRFVFTIGLPLVVIFGLPMALLALVTDLDERIWQAIIAGSVIAGGWLTTAIFAELGRAQARAEKLRDYHKALYAEIGSALVAFADEEGAGARTLARMRADEGFIPFIPREHNDHVFDAIVGELDALPRQTIDAIVGYYSLVKTISDFAEDLRAPRFRDPDLDQERRIAMYEDYLSMRAQAFAFGRYALALIRAFADGGPVAAEALALKVNSRDADPSGRLPGSE